VEHDVVVVSSKLVEVDRVESGVESSPVVSIGRAAKVCVCQKTKTKNLF
jgi:hypothetical protein